MYTYASDADYYICAMKVYEQEYTLLQGRKIAQPMKYISNALLAVVIAVVINYIIVRVYSSKRKASTKSLMNGLFEYRAFNNCNVVFTHQTKHILHENQVLAVRQAEVAEEAHPAAVEEAAVATASNRKWNQLQT